MRKKNRKISNRNRNPTGKWNRQFSRKEILMSVKHVGKELLILKCKLQLPWIRFFVGLSEFVRMTNLQKFDDTSVEEAEGKRTCSYVGVWRAKWCHQGNLSIPKKVTKTFSSDPAGSLVGVYPTQRGFITYGMAYAHSHSLHNICKSKRLLTTCVHQYRTS